jgi:hypothetical protein
MRKDMRRTLVRAICIVQSETAAMTFRIAARGLAGLEARYRPDQPRAPRGTPIGGQWISTGIANVPSQHVASEMTLFGRLSKQYRYENTLICLYDFGGQTWVLSYPKAGALGCHGATRYRVWAWQPTE